MDIGKEAIIDKEGKPFIGVDEEIVLEEDVKETGTLERETSVRTKQKIKVNVELFRAISFVGVLLFIVVGLFFTTFFVVFPENDNPSSPWDKITRKAPSDFIHTETYIYKLFGVNHSCSWVDFEPARSVSAVMQFCYQVPIMIFVILNYFRIGGESHPKFEKLKLFSKISSPFEFVFFGIFYMVFVNSPDGVYGTTEGRNQFLKHYYPYLLFKVALILMAIKQVWYHSLKETMPFSCITPILAWSYAVFLMFFGILYIVVTLAVAYGAPLFDPKSPAGSIVMRIILNLWTVLSVIVPLVFAFAEARTTEPMVIEFS